MILTTLLGDDADADLPLLANGFFNVFFLAGMTRTLNEAM